MPDSKRTKRPRRTSGKAGPDKAASGVPRREFGTMRGKVGLTDAFFEPLPEQELLAWEDSTPDPADEGS